jgi:predicted transcriptional regulator
MSDRGRNYVDAHSPYSGNLFLIHYRLGDLENDTYHHRLFMGVPYMARKCRCSKKTIQRALNQFVEDGFLDRIAPETAEKAGEYVFLFPETAVDILTSDASGGQTRKERWTNTETTPIYRTKSNVASDAGRQPYPDDFEAWWKIYPKPVNKKGTFGCWNATLRERGGTIESLMLATRLFADEMLKEGRQKQFIMNSPTFLGPGERWRESLPESFSPDLLEQAKAWDRIDAGWNDIAPIFPRPQDSQGNLLDGDGRAYYIDPMQPTKRRYFDDE